MRNPSSKRRRNIIFSIIALFLLYTVAGFLILPPIVRVVAVKELSKQLGRNVSIQTVRLNPYAFSATVRGFAIKEKDGTPFVSWDGVYVNFKFWSLFSHAWVVQEINVVKPSARVARNADGSFNFSDILTKFSTNSAPVKSASKPAAPAKPLAVVFEKIRVSDASLDVENRQLYTAAPAAANPSANLVSPTLAPNILVLQSLTNLFALLAGSTNQLSGTLQNLEVSNCAVHFVDSGNSRPARLDLSEIMLDATNLSNVPGTNETVHLSLRWNQSGSVNVDATASLQPPTLNLDFNLRQLDLGTLDPYLEPKLSLFILSSRVNLGGTVRLQTPPNQLPQVEFKGDLLLDGFRTVDGVMAEDLVKWGSIGYQGIDVTLNPEAVSLQKLVVSDPYERIVIETNQTINLFNALRLPSPLLTVTNAPGKVAAAKPASNPPNSAASEASPLPPVSLGEIVLTNETVHFTDRSITPNVDVEVEQVHGTISRISAGQPATINLHAIIEGIGSADITGTVNPFSDTATNTIKILVKDVDLTSVSPYSGKFAGYGIAEGKLNLDLEYQLVGKKLDAKNVIVLDQFTFGDPVNSPQATHLPVRLAIAILKDRQGKIVLDVPVQGRLDDPKFRIGKVVQRAILNILEKVATSPFSLLGAAFGGGGEELSYDEFDVGSAQLTPADIKKLDVLAKAMYDRPGLQLDITGGVDPDGDREGLQRAALDRQIRALAWMKLRKADQETNSVDQLVISPDERQQWIKTLYAQAVTDDKITPELLAANTNLAAFVASALPKKVLKGDAMLMTSYKNSSQSQTNIFHTHLVPPPDPMEAVLLATIPIDDNDLQALAASRAGTVERYLAQTGKVESSRLFLKNGAVQSLRRDGSRVWLQFR